MIASFFSGRGARVALCYLAATLAGCSVKKQTQIVVSVATDLAVPTEIDALGLEIRYVQPPQDIVDLSWQLAGADAITMPARFALLPGEDPSRQVVVTVNGLRNSRAMVTRTAVLPFARDRIVLVRLNLLRRCRGATCPPGQTCGELGCEVARKDPATLPDYSIERERSGFDASAADTFYLDSGSGGGGGDGGDGGGGADIGDDAIRRRDGSDNDRDGSPLDSKPDGIGSGTACPGYAFYALSSIKDRELRLGVSTAGIATVAVVAPKAATNAVVLLHHSPTGWSQRSRTFSQAYGDTALAVSPAGVTHLVATGAPPTPLDWVRHLSSVTSGESSAPGLGGAGVDVLTAGADVVAVADAVSNVGGVRIRTAILQGSRSGSQYAFSSVHSGPLCSDVGGCVSQHLRAARGGGGTVYLIGSGTSTRWRLRQVVNTTEREISGAVPYTFDAPAVWVGASGDGRAAVVESVAGGRGVLKTISWLVNGMSTQTGNLVQNVAARTLSFLRAAPRPALTYMTHEPSSGAAAIYARDRSGTSQVFANLLVSETLPVAELFMRAAYRGTPYNQLYVVYFAKRGGDVGVALRCKPFTP